MRNCLILTFILSLSFCCNTSAQNEANWWFFGANAGLDFNTGAPVATSVGSLVTLEGCASISSACGDLLFYTDGITVWDSSHAVMLDGNGLLGDPSSSQSGIIVPLPESTDLYYIFTVGDGFPATGLNYSVVDMTLNGGLGAVVPGSKNINLLQDSTEKISAAATASGDGAWLVTYGEANPTSGVGVFNTFYAFKLTTSGIDLTQTVTTTFPNVQMQDRRGYLRISPDGSKISMMTQLPVLTMGPTVLATGRGAWLFDFNNDTGVASNPIRLEIPADLQAYGTEFSLDSNLVYVDCNTIGSGIAGDRTLLQYDLNAVNFSTTPEVIFETDLNDPVDDVPRGALQLAPDNKIYYSRAGTTWLSVINNPNGIGAAAAFQNDGIMVSPGTMVEQGLPPFFNAFFNPSFSFQEGCVNDPSQFMADDIAICPGSSVLWDFGDPASGANNSSTLVDPIHIYNSTGTYTVTLSIISTRGVFNSTKTIEILERPVSNPVTDINICDDPSNDGFEIVDIRALKTQALGSQSAIHFIVSAYASQQDALEDFNELPDNFNATTGTYFIRIDNARSNGCFILQSIDINIAANPVINPIDDLNVCDDATNDGITTVDLTSAGAQALGAQSASTFTVTYHLTASSAAAGSMPLNNSYTTTSANTIIYVRIENILNDTCAAVGSFNINVIDQPVIPALPDFTLCDDPSRDNREVFNLDSYDIIVDPSSNPNNTISYHATAVDADADMNALSSPYTNTSQRQIIFVRLENNGIITCYDVAPLNLEVFSRPVVNLPDNIDKCENDAVTLSATPGFISYLWSTGETTSSIDVLDEDDYTVTVTDSNGCEDNATVSVFNYAQTIITDIDVKQFTVRDNRISVSVSGDGPFQYSIDDFIYQDSPVFTDLLPGFYTVYVRDLNGCDIVTAPATIIAAPNFFTPNGDGFHDFWQVTAIETEPDATIYIFDRFGKLLKQLNPVGLGWDGTYNGNPMPSSDYWFEVTLNDGRNFNGHFSLKR